MNHSASHRGTWIKLAINLLLLALAAWIFLNRQVALDTVNLLGYEPPVEIQKIADNTKMSDLGKRYFYVTHPLLSDRETFNAQCTNHGRERSIILGCYNGVNIFVYDINDHRLLGVEEVTSAHEMLHVAYDRLPDKEKIKINDMLDDQYESLKDERILDLIEIYRESQPAELYNEMHSIFATEVRDLTSELDEYYKKYFTDRLVVVGYSEQYEKVFGELKARQDTILKDIEQIVGEVKRRTSDFNEAISLLDQDIRAFNARAQAGDFESESEFNQQRSVLVSRVQALENERATINSLRSAFDRKQKELAALNLEVISLNQSLDSTPADVPTLQE